jgi:hypothetical protein
MKQRLSPLSLVIRSAMVKLLAVTPWRPPRVFSASGRPEDRLDPPPRLWPVLEPVASKIPFLHADAR